MADRKPVLAAKERVRKRNKLFIHVFTASSKLFGGLFFCGKGAERE
ncbi:hypothetical protein [Neobacillus sp. OS1-33]|nr:hypothetical protein [Neobacillus sp. OS1-33]WML28579.1 hypothetical protein RCG22_19800 [Neobacillus sp. OS1-33]